MHHRGWSSAHPSPAAPHLGTSGLPPALPAMQAPLRAEEGRWWPTVGPVPLPTAGSVTGTVPWPRKAPLSAERVCGTNARRRMRITARGGVWAVHGARSFRAFTRGPRRLHQARAPAVGAGPCRGEAGPREPTRWWWLEVARSLRHGAGKGFACPCCLRHILRGSSRGPDSAPASALPTAPEGSLKRFPWHLCRLSQFLVTSVSR